MADSRLNAFLTRVQAALAGSAHPLVEGLFLRLLGLVYLAAFGSLWPQVRGLFGQNGIVPAGQILGAIAAQSGIHAYLQIPTLFWLSRTDGWLNAMCALGCLASLVLIAGWFPRTIAFICWLLYLSLSSIGDPFLSFQWDALLLEAGFLAIFAGTPVLVWAYRLLLFRLLFESGLVKILSGDPNWRDGHALRFHFWTQPLPTPLAYYAAQLPPAMQDTLTWITLLIEFVAPCLLFCSRPLRRVGVGALMLLQVVILLTGNYAFFNLLTLALCLWGLDDSDLLPLRRWMKRVVPPWPQRAFENTATLALALIVLLGMLQLLASFLPGFRRLSSGLLRDLAPFEIVNSYGLFAVMTTERPEIVLEGSDDGKSWREYSFRYKPGELHRSPPLVAPYQPRLDWQMWFAALGDYPTSPWVGGLMLRLLQGEPSVLHLLEPSPFTGAPRFVRAVLYEYRFTSSDERERTGGIWKRNWVRVWFGPVSLPQRSLS